MPTYLLEGYNLMTGEKFAMEVTAHNHIFAKRILNQTHGYEFYTCVCTKLKMEVE